MKAAGARDVFAGATAALVQRSWERMAQRARARKVAALPLRLMLHVVAIPRLARGPTIALRHFCGRDEATDSVAPHRLLRRCESGSYLPAVSWTVIAATTNVFRRRTASLSRQDRSASDRFKGA